MNSVELREARAKAIHDARSVLDRADAEKRELSAEENQVVDKHFAEADALEAKINTVEKREAVERAESSLKDSKRKTIAQLSPQTDDPDAGDALRCWLSRGVKGHRLTADMLDNAARCGVDLDGGFEIPLTHARLHRRAMNKTNTTGSVQWSDFYQGYYEELKAYAPVLSLISYRNSDNGQPLPIPVMNDTTNKAAILAEEGASTAQDFAVSNVTLGSYKYESKEIVLSLELLQDSSEDLVAYVSKAIAARFARAWAEHVTVGTGSGQPHGIVTRSTDSGVVATGTAAAPTLSGDVLIDLAESLDDAYRAGPGVGYMMNPATIAKVRKLKDTNGQYLWQPSLQAGIPATFYGFPVYRNHHMAVSGANARIATFGDYSNYLWRNVMGIEVYRLNELRILNGQISFQAFARGTGNLILPNAVKYLAAPAS
jgi:HK97 family phage major capsid protein